jgi:hypothetical protein
MNKFLSTFHEFFLTATAKTQIAMRNIFYAEIPTAAMFPTLMYSTKIGKTPTLHDWLLTNIIGYEKYKKLVLTELKKFQSKKSLKNRVIKNYQSSY